MAGGGEGDNEPAREGKWMLAAAGKWQAEGRVTTSRPGREAPRVKARLGLGVDEKLWLHVRLNLTLPARAF